MSKTPIVLAITAVVVSLVALFGSHGSSQNLSGTVHNFPEIFSAGIQAGATNQFSVDGNGLLTVTAGTDLRAQTIQTGSVTSISSGSYLMTAAQICDSTLIHHTVTGVGVTSSKSSDKFPTPASLIADCLPTIGDSKTINFSNGSNDGEVASFSFQTVTNAYDVFVASSQVATLMQKQAATVRLVNRNGTRIQVYITVGGVQK